MCDKYKSVWFLKVYPQVVYKFPNKFSGDFQDTFNKVPGGFLHRLSLTSITTWHTNTCTSSYVRHYE